LRAGRLASGSRRVACTPWSSEVRSGGAICTRHAPLSSGSSDGSSMSGNDALRIRSVEKVRAHVNLTILTKHGCALVRAREDQRPVPVAAYGPSNFSRANNSEGWVFKEGSRSRDGPGHPGSVVRKLRLGFLRARLVPGGKARASGA
jgi:hypothetical protein